MKKTVVVLVMVMMAVGFEWSLPQGTKDAFQITFKNQFSFDVSFYVNGYFVCSAKANSSCKAPVKIGKGSFKLEARGGPLNKVMASETFDPLVPGEDIVWATGNVERNPIPSPISPQAVANQTAPKGSAVSFVTSVATLNYQGRKAQNRAQTGSLAKIERQTSSTGATYALSGEGGLRIGKDGTAAFYGVSPIMVNRNLSDDRLSSDEKGLSLWLTVINDTLNGLTHKHMASGAWEESISLSLGDEFPETIHAGFRAQPLPKPDSKWILITADSGYISFRALDEKYQDSLIRGRYRGVLVYSPTEDEFLQAAAALTLYHGEDQFRIEQLHFAADASGKQLNPVLDVRSYLDFKQEAPTITTQGSFPSWCVQATQVFDILHTAIMTAAEGSTNWVPITIADHALLNWICRDAYGMAKIFGRAVAELYVEDWMKLLDFIDNLRKEGKAKALYELAKDLANDLLWGSGPFARAAQFKKFMDLYAAVVWQSVSDLMQYDIDRLMAFPAAPAPQPTVPTKPPSPTPPPTPPPTPKTGSGAGAITAVAVAVAAGVGAYYLGKYLAGTLTGPYDGTYRGNFWSATPCVFHPCAVSYGNITFTVLHGDLSGGGALQGRVDSAGEFTGTWSTGVSNPFSMHGSFKNNPVRLEGPNTYGGEGTLSTLVIVSKQ
jgi:hypothetical protein